MPATYSHTDKVEQYCISGRGDIQKKQLHPITDTKNPCLLDLAADKLNFKELVYNIQKSKDSNKLETISLPKCEQLEKALVRRSNDCKKQLTNQQRKPRTV